jgi:hypothetical protein
MTDVPLDTIADAVDALTNQMRVRTPYDTWHGNNRRTEWHEVKMPSLIAQLEAAAIPGEVYLEETGGGVRRAPGSCPPARLDAINLSLAITAWAADNAWKTTRRVREDTPANLRALVGAQLDSDTAAALLRDLRRWVHSARIIAGWQRPPWRPDAPCPACDQRGLRVRLDTSTAACTQCLETWDRDTIGLLAEHVRKTTLRPVLA